MNKFKTKAPIQLVPTELEEAFTPVEAIGKIALKLNEIINVQNILTEYIKEHTEPIAREIVEEIAEEVINRIIGELTEDVGKLKADVISHKTRLDALTVNKQDKRDDTLTTTSKFIVSAINEINAKADSFDQDKQDKLTTLNGILIDALNNISVKVDGTTIGFDTDGKLKVLVGGAVDSVNGKTGEVVLKAEDIEDNDGNTIEEDLSALANDIEDLDTNKQDKLTQSNGIIIDSSTNISVNVDGTTIDFDTNGKVKSLVNSYLPDDETIELDENNKLKVKHDDVLEVGTNGLTVAVDDEKGIEKTADEKLAVKVDGTTIDYNEDGKLQSNVSGGYIYNTRNFTTEHEYLGKVYRIPEITTENMSALKNHYKVDKIITSDGDEFSVINFARAAISSEYTVKLSILVASFRNFSIAEPYIVIYDGFSPSSFTIHIKTLDNMIDAEDIEEDTDIIMPLFSVDNLKTIILYAENGIFPNYVRSDIITDIHNEIYFRILNIINTDSKVYMAIYSSTYDPELDNFTSNIIAEYIITKGTTPTYIKRNYIIPFT